MKKIYITKEQIDNLQTLINENEGKNSMLLNEENKGQKKKCVENIINNTPGIIRRFLDMELTNLPPQFQTMLNPDGALFKAVSNNQTGANKFIDYLRLNLYQQFGIGRDSNLTQFIPGISRIACADCHFYAFDLSIDGGKILELSRVLRFIDKKPEYMLSDVTLDANLNGLSYNEFMETFENKVKNYISNVKDKLSSDEYRVVNTSDYTIIPIEDKMVDRHGGKVLVPTTNGRKILDKIGRYTDWCVCNNQYANEEFSQYLSNGGKMYVCAKKGFEKIKRPKTTNTPLDEYGLSLINVIVDQDGLPSNVTTRYNHDFGGENHSEMWEATHLQRLLNVNFFDVFKPRNKEELRQLHLSENKVPAAQDQVKKRVNAGIMDSICSGVFEEVDIKEYFNSDKDIVQESQNDRLVNKLIKEKLGFDDFYQIRKFALQVCHAIPNVRFNKCYYLLGVTRLVIDEKLRGKHISELNKILLNIENRGDKLSRDLDGMSFIDLWDEYYEDEIITQAEIVEKIRTTPTGYVIKHIETFDDSYNSGPQDWCITYEEEYFYFLVDAKDCIYIVENPQMMAKINTESPEFMENCRKMENPTVNDLGEYGSGEPPYDNFGLSRFVVTVNPSDIMVYSRWNLPDGLDGDFLNKEELEEVLGMPFNEAFPYIKPKELSDKERAYLYENKINSEQIELKKRTEEISEFMKNDGLNVFPYPETEFNYDEQNGLFILTGYYLPSDKKIVLFCKDRHPKDILRSFAHEMIHHMQNLDGKKLNFTNKDNVKDNNELEELESEAYLKGNIYFRKWTEYERNNRNGLNESIISLSQLRELTKELDEGERWTIYAPIVDESLEPNEVDLSSFNIKKNLNPKFWKNDLLDSRIRMKLLDIADDFIEFLGVDWVKPEDITITGSLANYNWNQKHSDIDLHIIMDFSKVDERTDFVENYFYSQKKLWNEEHKDLKIFGFPIEVYVQDVKQNHTSNGVYSLEKNEWLTEPDREKLSNAKINKTKIKNSVSKYTEKIDKLIDELSDSDNDEYKIRNVSEKAEKLFDEIKEKRKNDLSKSKNEINNGNIIFKCLRRLGYIEKIDNIINKCYNKLNSLP